ncbi:MAG: VOC family protein [Acidobacteria bacterium]|nr:VOC family protein [Acidobacteriota bacterium]
MTATPLTTGHIGLNVSSLERSREFYTSIFGFDVLRESAADGRRFAFLGKDANLVLTLWQQSDGRFEKGRPGLHHLSFQAPSIEAVREAERKLRARGSPFHYDGVVPHAEGAQSGGIFFEDPDGIRLEIFAASGASDRPVAVADGPACGFF